ncbi:MAG: D-alanyl-D-alanine carboxypeptidase/D-alanyl-D-alanine-endopeptidase [Ferruginibacter sp.]
MKLFTTMLFWFVYNFAFAQTVEVKLLNAVKQFGADTQFKHAIFSLYVVDSKTGKAIFDKNSQVGLAPASSLKVVTSTAAFELLGKDYRYKTDIAWDENMDDSTLKGNLLIRASGDPTFGSWRWENTKADTILKEILVVLKAKNIKTITGNFILDDSKWSTQATPGGWTWEDIGNYYGAGARGINWHENQYDLFLKPGKNAGSPVEILRTEPILEAQLVNELKTGKEGSGDNSIIYLSEEGSFGYVRGTVPAGVSIFKVSGAMPSASVSFNSNLRTFLWNNNVRLIGKSKSAVLYFSGNEKIPLVPKILLSIFSPPLDSINYWFLQKSVNLFGEAFVKTMAFEKTGFGSTEAGIDIIKDLWSKKGIEPSALNMIDGSGLSPANRVTTNALVTVMQYAKKQNWFASFYNALPEQNGIKMKSGYIGGVRSYTGYIKSKTGAEYTFAFIINNFDGSPGTVREKMWKLLDILKAP